MGFAEEFMLTEAFNTQPYEVEMFKKGASDVYFVFEDGDDTFRIQFYSSNGLGKNVRRVYIGTKQGGNYKDVIKKFDNPAKIIATFIDATEKFLETPIGKGIDGFAFDLSQKASPRGVKILPKVLKLSKVIRKRLTLVDVDIEVDKGRSVIWAVKKGKKPSEVFNGNKVEGLMPDTTEGTEKEPESVVNTSISRDLPDDIKKSFISKYPVTKGKLESIPFIRGDNKTGNSHVAQYMAHNGEMVIMMYEEFFKQNDNLREHVLAHETGHVVSGMIGRWKGGKLAMDKYGLDVWSPQPLTDQMPFGRENIEEAFSDVYAVLLTNAPADIKRLIEHWPKWHDFVAGESHRVGMLHKIEPVSISDDPDQEDSEIDPSITYIYDYRKVIPLLKKWSEGLGMPLTYRQTNPDQPEIMAGGTIDFEFKDAEGKLWKGCVEHDGYDRIRAMLDGFFRRAKTPEEAFKVIEDRFLLHNRKIKLGDDTKEMLADVNVDIFSNDKVMKDKIQAISKVVIPNHRVDHELLNKAIENAVGVEIGKFSNGRQLSDWDQIMVGAIDRELTSLGVSLHPDDFNKLRRHLSSQTTQLDSERFINYMDLLADRGGVSDLHVNDTTDSLLAKSRNISEKDKNLIGIELPKILKLCKGKTTLETFILDAPRAYHQPGKINVGSRLTPSTIWHEMGHDIEASFPWVHKACLDYIQQMFGRVKDKSKPVNDMGRMGTGVRGEWALDDPSWDSYTTRLYFPNRIMKDEDEGILFDPHDHDPEYLEEQAGRLGATEVLSMGLQFFCNPSKANLLWQNDPELFNFVRGILEGLSE